MFQRTHHKVIALILQALDAELLKKLQCYFGGGTAIVLKYGEYRESVDMDFLISDAKGYRELRQLVKESSLKSLFKMPLPNMIEFQNIKVDQYGIRSALKIMDQKIKQRHEYLARCCQVLAMNLIPAEVWQKLRRIERWVS